MGAPTEAIPLAFQHLTPPSDGSKITIRADGSIQVPDDPVLPHIVGDGTGPDIWAASQPVLDAAVKKAYGGKKRIVWFRVYAGEEANKAYGEWLPNDTLEAFRQYVVGIKGPLTTPVGKGIRSLNVALRQELDLYACVRPVYYVQGVPSPMKDPSEMNIVIFRENTEDVYAGVEFQAGTPEAKKLQEFLVKELGVKASKFRGQNVGLGIKPMSEEGSKRLVRKAIQYAIDNKLPSVSLVHKGNIMKFTEGAFMSWGYEVATKEFRDHCVTWAEVQEKHGGKTPAGKVLVQDVIADNMFQQLLTRTENYSVLATPNLNGDYLSDAAAGEVGGLGIAPGGNVGHGYAVFEATHGTAPKYAGQDKVNPGSVILSGVMMLDYLGWKEAAQLVRDAFQKTVAQGLVTYDFAREMSIDPIRASEFGACIVANIEGRPTPIKPRHGKVVKAVKQQAKAHVKAKAKTVRAAAKGKKAPAKKVASKKRR
ncbi:MAG TPA: isocitrate dehydrogenase (NADP(+)) [Candidatus Thermoplasmatota archaeon]|nr:isocitrate dehydrogenase (NADP(+)) [Candidatus Thermoplasmatota archaeon]